MAKIYPLDVKELKKGQSFTGEELASIIGCPLDSKKFPFQRIALRKFIERESRRLGMPLHVSTPGKGLHIMTESEAAKAEPARSKQGIRAGARAHARSLDVDITQLPDKERAKFEEQVNKNARIFSAAQAAAFEAGAKMFGNK